MLLTQLAAWVLLLKRERPSCASRGGEREVFASSSSGSYSNAGTKKGTNKHLMLKLHSTAFLLKKKVEKKIINAFADIILAPVVKAAFHFDSLHYREAKSMSSDLTRPSAGQIGGDKLSFYHLWVGEEE